ncbi:hypothetical protein M0R45_028536 [Rubus argutus]|uniref:Pentatricopeptide repeat-containing protein n=1 Tax=Rubus argutus TaxID=59490 RepID=A0AAW1W4Z1_RUBAR
MHPKPTSFLQILHRNKQILRPLCSSICVPTSPTSQNLNLPLVSELLAKQHWSELRTHLKDSNFTAVLHQLLDSGADPVLILRNQVAANSNISNMLVLAYANNSKTRMGVEAFQKAGDYGFKLNVFSCNPLLRALVKESEIGKLQFVYKEMIRRRIEPNLYTFNMVIRGLCKAGKLEKAKDVIINDMKAWGISPNVGNMEMAMKLLHEMEANGLRADRITYNTLINGLCKEGESRKAETLLDEMFEKGLSSNHLTYNFLMDGYCREGNLSAALNLRAQMEKGGKRPNVATYNVLIKGYSLEDKLEHANGLLNEMLEKGLIPNQTTYERVKEGMMKKAQCFISIEASILDSSLF